MSNQITNVITTSVTIPLDFQSNSMAWTVGTAESPKVRWRTNWKAVKHCKKRSKKLSRTPRMPSATKTRPNKDVLESVVTKTLDSTKGLMEDAGHYGFNKVGIYANGFGGTYDQIIQIDSRDCGYDKDFSTAVKKLTVQDRQKLFRG